MRSRTVITLTVLSAVLALGEFVSAVINAIENYRDSVPIAGVVFGVFFLVGTWLLGSGRITLGAVLVAVLCLFEVVAYPSFQRHNALDWIFQTSYTIVSLVGLGSAIMVFVSRRRSPAGVAGRGSHAGTA